MCGIAGIYNHKNKSIVQSDIQKMTAMLEHRGPDGTGYYCDGHVGLGHTRLSIIDLSTGQQPIHNEDKTVWVVFNGEIFNYIELRNELQSKGHVFYTKTDTEVIVHLYEEYDESFVHYLNGQFSIALWDTNKHKLILIRDRAGIVPLFYTEKDDQLLFASEIKAILPVQNESPSLNPHALDQLMTFWAPVSPGTIFSGVYEVSPGNMLIAESGSVKVKTYWNWEFCAENEYMTESEANLMGSLHDLLVDAVKIRLRSDVPVGAYLSGGLDSSIITSLIHAHSNVDLKTFSIGFDDKGLDEATYQDKMVEHIGANHSRIHCRHEDVSKAFFNAIWHTESPILRTAPVPMGILSGLVHNEKYKVVLTGEGADEVFGGYDIFKEAKIRRFWSKYPESSFRPVLLKRLYPYLDLSKSQGLVYLKNFFGTALDNPDLNYFSHLPRWNTTAKCKEFFSADLKAKLTDDAIDILNKTLPENLLSWNYFNRAQYIESKSLMSGYLLSSQGDRMLMQNSVEGRFPFLDHRVIEFANRIDPRLKMRVLNEKYILKNTMKKYLPNDIVARYKQPYRAPDIAAFFNVKTPEYVNELMGKGKINEYGYFDSDRIAKLMKKIKLGRAIGHKDNMAFVGMLSTQLWHYHFIENYHKNFTNLI